MTEYTHYHNPAAGRHGLVVSLRDDTPACEYHGTVQKDDYCDCTPCYNGSTWAAVMSTELPVSSWEQEIHARMRISGQRKLADWELEEMLETVQMENDERAQMEERDVSYSHGTVGRVWEPSFM